MSHLKRIFLCSCITGILAGAVSLHAADDALKPYILAGVREGELDTVATTVTEGLKAAGFEVVGACAPMGAADMRVICITTPALKQAASKAGGLLGFAAVLRVGLHRSDGGVQVSFMNPVYWGLAYYRKEFSAVEAVYKALDTTLRAAMTVGDGQGFMPFGSEKGLSPRDLIKYHYMMAMPYFDDVVVLAEKCDYDAVTAAIEKAARAEGSTSTIVYSIKFPEQKMALYGVSLGGDKGEKSFLPKIDAALPRHVPFLPYEMLVLEDRVVMLHGKYRIALSFPDLTMGTFMKIVSTPGDIADAMRQLTEQN